MAKFTKDPRDIWEYRREFLQAAQLLVPGFGSFLQDRSELLQDASSRAEIIREWQMKFNLSQPWAFQCAKLTLSIWDRSPESRSAFQWFAAPRLHNLAEEGLPHFTFRIDRDYYPSFDFGWFKRHLHALLELELERFRETTGIQNLEDKRRPKNLERAYECLALRICLNLPPPEIRNRPGYSSDWTTLSRDMKRVADLIGLALPRPGRPKNIGQCSSL